MIDAAMLQAPPCDKASSVKVYGCIIARASYVGASQVATFVSIVLMDGCI